MNADDVYVMSPMEIAWGYVFGHEPIANEPTDSGQQADPRRTLERILRDALRRTPCGVAFSGGRDSSLVLAVATHVARREGLSDPIAVTKVYPDVPESEESEWQELVLRHLGLRDWQRITIRDELDLLGPLATRNLRQHGVLWPPTVHGDQPVLESVRGGTLIDGEGGDEILDTRDHRIGSVTNVLRRPRPIQRRRVKSALAALAPAPLRRREVRRQLDSPSLPWLRPDARNALIVEACERVSSSPLSFAKSVRRVPYRRSQRLLRRNRVILAREHDVEIKSPLLDPDFVESIARVGGTLGNLDRTTTLRNLAPDLLPDAVLARESKALFGGAFWGRHVRNFAEQWRGDGLDDEMVDASELRRLWLSDDHHALTSALVQAAWIAGTTIDGSETASDRTPS